MKNLVFVKKENIKADLTKEIQVKSAFFYFSKSSGITLIALVISIIVILILAAVSLNTAIGKNGIISNAQNSKLKSEVSNAEGDILEGLASLDAEYYQKASGDMGISIDNIYSISGLQQYVNGKVNGFNYNKDGETVIYYTNGDGSYTVKIKDGKATTYFGIYVTEEESPYIYMSTENGNNTIYLSTDLEDAVWASLNESIATVDPKTGLVTKNAKGTVMIVGENAKGETVYITIRDDDEIANDANDTSFAKTVNVKETKNSVNIGATASDNVKASIVINDKGETVLQISGTGNMGTSAIAFSGYSEENYNAVTSIIIEDGVKNITENVFDNFKKAKSITIASTVEKIHSFYIRNLQELETINMNAKNPTIESRIEDGKNYYCANEVTTNIVIGEDVEEITLCEFYCYTAIKNVKMSNNVKEIGISAFESCENLENIILSNNLTSIGMYAFSNCYSLTNINIPSGVTIINEDTFKWCESLKSINIPSSVTWIGKEAFEYCNSLKNITIPENVTSIGKYAFAGCDNLKTVYYNAINCDYSDFYEDEYSYPLFNQKEEISIEKIVIGNKVEKIPNGIFSYLTNISEINIPDSVNLIEDEAFINCINVNKLNFGNNVASIGYKSFAYLSTLPEVTIPENVTSIGIYAFYNCNNLEKVYYNAINASYDGVYYRSSDDSLIGYSMFEKCDNITNLTLGNNVKYIGDDIFANLNGITEITLPESLKSIGMFAFANNNNLQTIHYNAIDCATDEIFVNVNNKTYIGVPFKGTGVTNIEIGNKVGILNECIFGFCNIETITIPSNVRYITPKDDVFSGSFYGCTNLKEILIQKPEGSISGAPWSNVSGITVKWNQ